MSEQVGNSDHILDYALDCFEAAECEGWLDALQNGDIDQIRDLWNRRMAWGVAAIKQRRPMQ